MHDDLIERRLRVTLREAADHLPFTITAAELERRAALRGRGAGNRRLTLLLAAAVGIGALGVGGAIGGLFDGRDDPSPGPTTPAVLPTVSAPPAALPALDDMIAIGEGAGALVAQAHGPADGPALWQAEVPEPPASVTLDMPAEPGEVRLLFACLGQGTGEISVAVRFPAPIPPAQCDGTVLDVLVNSPRSVTLRFAQPASWRVVALRGQSRPPHSNPAAQPPILTVPDGEEALVTIEQLRIDAELGPPDSDGRIRLELEAVTARWWYRYSMWCDGGSDAQYIHGDEVDGVVEPNTTTRVPCDGAVHTGELRFPEPFGSRTYLAAAPGTVVSIVVSSEEPPVSLLREQPGWQLSAGSGPDLSFDTHESSFTGPGVEGGGSVLIAFDCVGTEPVVVSIEWVESGGNVIETFGAQFRAECSPDGALTTQSFEVEDSYVNVSYTAVAGTWTAMTILVPDP